MSSGKFLFYSAMFAAGVLSAQLANAQVACNLGAPAKAEAKPEAKLEVKAQAQACDPNAELNKALKIEAPVAKAPEVKEAPAPVEAAAAPAAKAEPVHVVVNVILGQDGSVKVGDKVIPGVVANPAAVSALKPVSKWKPKKKWAPAPKPVEVVEAPVADEPAPRLMTQDEPYVHRPWPGKEAPVARNVARNIAEDIGLYGSPSLNQIREPAAVAYSSTTYRLPERDDEPTSVALSRFRASGIAAVQNTGASSFSFELSWNPEFSLNEFISLGVNAGWMIFGDQTKAVFNALEGQGVLVIHPNTSLSLETAAGMQSFIGAGQYSGTHPVVSETIGYKFKKKTIGIIDRIFAGYSAYMMPGFLTSEIKLGLGFSL